MSLCIIACSRTVSAGLQRLPMCRSGIQLAVGAEGARSLQGVRFKELTEAADMHVSSPLHCHLLLAILPPSSVLQTSSLPVLSLAEQSHPLNSGRAGNQISLPVCSTEKHIIFLCRDRNVFLIYHPLPYLGLLLKSVLFLF